MIKIFHFVLEVFNWLKIVASPFLIGLFLGILFYIYKPDETGIIIGGFMVLVGLAVGIYLAIVISKEVGATKFMFKINETQDLNDYDESKQKHN